MANPKNIWKYGEDEWKVHIDDSDMSKKICDELNLSKSTFYYENGDLSKETSCDFIVSKKELTKIKKLLKDNT
jgi:hypothetical protein|tara:strand:- start:31 stop:249 length:219 start_codon:yes stop_codon:yes gene_type:complete